MEVTLGKYAGFCFGVRRAVEMLEKELADGENAPIYTWGPIIHNEEVVRDFEERGVRAVDSVDALLKAKEEKAGGTVVIRSHGVSASVMNRLEAEGFRVTDATCPFVKRIHGIVRKASEEGRHVIVVGNPVHPEVEGIVGWVSPKAAADRPVTVVETAEEAASLDLPAGSAVTIVSQTTFRKKKFQEIVEIIRSKEYDMNVADTICSATEERQHEAEELAAVSDAMIVVGDVHSSNTRKLYEICSGICPHTEFIHTPEDLKNLALPPSARRIGITAGASTPQKIIEEVVQYVRSGQEFY